MARLVNGINGPLLGKVGTVIGQTWKGEFYVRSLPVRRKKEKGPLEAANQSDFALLHSWLHPILGFLRAGFNGYSNRVHAFNAAKSLALKNAFQGKKGERVFDPALVQVSWGDLPLPSGITVEKSGDFEVTFSWDVDPKANGGHEYDQAMLLVYNDADKKSMKKLPGQFRSTGWDKLSISNDHPGSYHVFFAFMAHDRSRQSSSVYLGKVELGV